MNRISTRGIMAFAVVATVLTAIAAYSSPRKPRARQAGFVQTNLVSDVPGVAAFTDPHLVNAWGISKSGSSPFWISDNGTGLTTLYNTAGKPQALVVTIPNPTSADPSKPTGQVFNRFGGVQAFKVGPNAAGNSAPAIFIFATEDGTIAGWNPGISPAAVQMVNNSGSAIYKGLAIGDVNGTPYLYAANFHEGTIDVFDSSFSQVHWAGAFQDPNIKQGYAPFNVQNLGGMLYVSYAMQDAEKTDEIAGPSRGFVDVYDTSGNLVKRVATHGLLNAPWGMVSAPSSFGDIAGMLLVGNFGDGRISIVDPNTGEFIDQLRGTDGRKLSIDGLWALDVGNGGNGGSTSKVYFTAGPEDESHGLFGSLEPAP